VNQGAIGNCYFLSSISGVANTPVNVRAMFYTKRYNAAGIFCVHFFVNGIKKAVIVDDYFPVYSWGVPAFAHSN
jgi:calpain-15